MSADARFKSSRNGRGAPLHNANAKKALQWLDSYDLSSPAGLQAFMQEVIKQVWCGRLGTRAGSTINGTLKLLLEYLALPTLEKRIAALELDRGERIEPRR